MVTTRWLQGCFETFQAPLQCGLSAALRRLLGDRLLAPRLLRRGSMKAGDGSTMALHYLCISFALILQWLCGGYSFILRRLQCGFTLNPWWHHGSSALNLVSFAAAPGCAHSRTAPAPRRVCGESATNPSRPSAAFVVTPLLTRKYVMVFWLIIPSFAAVPWWVLVYSQGTQEIKGISHIRNWG